VRLEVLEHGHRRRARIALGLIRRVTGKKPDEVAMTSLYRPAFFGRPWMALLRDVLRGPSPWSPGERELLAAFVSRLNRCPYCVGIHSGTAALGLDRPVTIDMLDHWREEMGLSPKLTAVFGLLERVVTDPDAVSAGDVQAVRATGVTADAIVDALYVAFVFNLINRLVNVFGYSWESEEERLLLARVLHRINYRVPGFLLR
jgi:uncharacterized peroxidase-related enzyme